MPCRLFPGAAQACGKALIGRRRVLVHPLLAGIAIPAHRRPGNEHPGPLLAQRQPGQQVLGEGDAAVAQFRAPRLGPGTVGNRRAGQVDHRIQRLAAQLVEIAQPLCPAAAQFGHLPGAPAPDPEFMPLGQPVAAQGAPDQAGTASQ
ncbi:hypothetical protein D3C77_546350 [compost metagenome]